jgi:hypothetical protein
LRRGRGQSKHHNEPSYSTKCVWYLDKLRYYKIPKKKLCYPEQITLTQSNTTQVYFNFKLMCALHVPACTYIRSKKEWKSVLNKIMAQVHITQIWKRLLMQLRVIRVQYLKKMCLISKSLYRKVISVLNQTALSRQKKYLIFRGPCIVIYSYNKNQRDARLLKFILL